MPGKGTLSNFLSRGGKKIDTDSETSSHLRLHLHENNQRWSLRAECKDYPRDSQWLINPALQIYAAPQ